MQNPLRCLLFTCGAFLVLSGSFVHSARGEVEIPFTVRAVDGGVEVVTYRGTDRLLRPGDFIGWVATPDTKQMGAVSTPQNLNAEITARTNAKNVVCLWMQRGSGNAEWVFLTLPPRSTVSKTAGELPAELGGLTLLSGFQHLPQPQGRHGETWGRVSGPGNLELEYSIWPVAGPGQPRHSGHFVSDAQRLAPNQRQWFKEQFVGDDQVQIALSNANRLLVSFPSRGLNLSGDVKDKEQLTDALLTILSIPNQTRGLSWQDAVSVLQHGDVATVTQLHSLVVTIRMASGMQYRTTEPRMDEVFNLLKKFGKYDDVGKITE